ncbi:MAG: hypothetical protein WCG78_05780 [Candidatus Omnitrophota bacterium]
MKKRMVFAVAVLFVVGCAAYAHAEGEPQKPAGTIASQQFKPREVKMDRNHDGKVDHIEIYDEKGVIVKVENDTKGDGKINEWVTYENGIPVKGEKDINGSGKPNMTLFYDAKGQVTKSEADINGDGKVDEWVYYENGKPVRAEKDSKGDGKPDTWVTY